MGCFHNRNERNAASQPTADEHLSLARSSVLAWELAAAANPHLSRVDADRIYVAIGVGDTFEAIDALLAAIARDRIPLDLDALATVASWPDCYRGQEAAARLRRLLADVEVIPPRRAPASRYVSGQRSLARGTAGPVKASCRGSR